MTAYHCEEQSVLPRLTPVFHCWVVTSHRDQWPGHPSHCTDEGNGDLLTVVIWCVIIAGLVVGLDLFTELPLGGWCLPISSVLLATLCLSVGGSAFVFNENPVPCGW